MKRIIVLLATMLLTLSMIGPAWGNGPADRQTSDVYELVMPEPGVIVGGDVTGTAQLVRTDTGVSYNLRTTGLEQGHAISIWWVIFNNPEECAEDCTLPDLFNPDVAASVQSGGGHAVGASGNSAFAGHLNEGEVTNSHPLHALPGLANPGLLDPRGAEIHLVVRTHGELIPGMNHEMFTTFEGGCTADTSFGAGDGPNECADLQFAIFK